MTKLKSLLQPTNELRDPKKITTDVYRQPYYKLMDGFYQLVDAAKDIDDDKMITILKRIEVEHNKLYKYLNSTYNWD
jgi:hypothetical protein